MLQCRDILDTGSKAVENFKIRRKTRAETTAGTTVLPFGSVCGENMEPPLARQNSSTIENTHCLPDCVPYQANEAPFI